MPEDAEDVLEAGPSSAKRDTTGPGWPTPPRLDSRSLEKRGDQTGQDGNLHTQHPANGQKKEEGNQKIRVSKKKRKKTQTQIKQTTTKGG